MQKNEILAESLEKLAFDLDAYAESLSAQPEHTTKETTKLAASSDFGMLDSRPAPTGTDSLVNWLLS